MFVFPSYFSWDTFCQENISMEVIKDGCSKLLWWLKPHFDNMGIFYCR